MSAAQRMAGKSFIIHPDVDARVILRSTKELTATEFFVVLISVLKPNGFEAVVHGETARIVPIAVPPLESESELSSDRIYCGRGFRSQ